MRLIGLTDETLCGKKELTFKEKLEIAGALDEMNVQQIELPAPEKKQDTLLYKAMAAKMKNAALAVRVPLTEAGAQEAYKTIAEAKSARLIVRMPLSLIEMEYQLKLKPKNAPALIERMVKACAALNVPVTFAAQDATRADPAFLCEAVRLAVQSGADSVVLCDCAGQSLPEEFAALVTSVRDNALSGESAALYASCGNDLGLALPCALAALKGGADGIITAVGADAHPSPAVLGNVMDKRGSTLQMRVSLDMARLNALEGDIADILTAPKKDTTPFETGVRPAVEGETLTAESGIRKVYDGISHLGYDLSEEDKQKVFEAFRMIAQKKAVTYAELDAIIASVAMQVPARYVLDSYVINTGNVITATAHVKLLRDGGAVEGISLGDGPIDAAFLAIEKIIGHHFELDDFQIRSVTEGREAMGDALVRLRANGKLYAGRGTSTDIVGASIRAYLSALNKIVYDEVNA